MTLLQRLPGRALFVVLALLAVLATSLMVPAQRVAAADCDEPYSPEGGPSVSVSPAAGAPGSSFNMTVSSLRDDATRLAAMWDVETTPQELASTNLDGQDTYVFMGLHVPMNATPGDHLVAACYFVPDYYSETGGGYWEYISVYYTVQIPPTSTAVPPTATRIPPTPTRVHTFTPVPTNTLFPTATPFPTVTPFPTFTPVPLDTLVPTATSTIPAPQATIAVPPPPPPATATLPPPPTVRVVASTSTPTALPTETATLTATVSPTATRTSTPTPTVVVAAQPPPGPPAGPNADLPKIFQVVPLISEVQDVNVGITNAALAGLTLVLVLITAQVFNQTISENQGEIEAILSKIMAPVQPIKQKLQKVSETQAFLRDFGWLAFVVALTVLVYGFLEPGFSLNRSGLILIGNLLITSVGITYMTEGLEAFIDRRLYHQTAAVRIFPFAVVIACVCVLLSRAANFLPGVVYGFIGTAVFLRPSTMDEDESARSIYIPAVMLLGLSVLTWLAVAPLRQWANDSNSFMAAFLEGAAIAVFIGGIEGLFFNMMPLTFMDGAKIWRWNKLAWLPVAGISTWLFWEVLLHQQSSYYSSLKQTTTWVALLLAGSCLALTVSTWLYFRWRAGHGGASEEVSI